MLLPTWFDLFMICILVPLLLFLAFSPPKRYDYNEIVDIYYEVEHTPEHWEKRKEYDHSTGEWYRRDVLVPEYFEGKVKMRLSSGKEVTLYRYRDMSLSSHISDVVEGVSAFLEKRKPKQYKFIPEEKPTAAFTVSLLAGIFILINGILIMAASATPAIGITKINFVALFGIGELIFGLIVMFGAIMINSDDPSKVRTGGIIVLIFSIISIIAGGGFLIGLILGLIGGILALTWKPSTQIPPPSS
jgi:hypothetical protein